MEKQGLPLATSFGQDACSGRTVARVVEAAPKLQGAGVREVEEAVDIQHVNTISNGRFECHCGTGQRHEFLR